MGLLRDKLLIASGQGRLFLYDAKIGDFDIVFETPNPNEYFMGISQYKDRIFISSNLLIYELLPNNDIWDCINSISFFPVESMGYNPKIQHIKVIGDKLFAPTMASNSFYIMELNEAFDLIADIKIIPSVVATDYDNAVDIFFDKGLFYCCFNSIGSSPEDGGIMVLDSSLRLIDRGYYGWDCYNYSIINDDKYILCNKIDNKRAGLVFNDNFKIVYDSFYCMDYAINDDFIAIVGGVINLNNTTQSGGIVLLFDREFKTIGRPTFLPGGGQFMGCMFIENDLTNNLWKQDISNVKISPYDDKRVKVRDLSYLETTKLK